MLDDFILQGEKGKKGGAADANTLHSKARARFIEVLSEGPIVGLVAGQKSVYFDQTAVQNADNTYNVKNVVLQENKGYPDDNHFRGFAAVETPVQVETEVKKSIGPVVRTITEVNADALRIIIRLNALVKQTSKGKLVTNSVSFAIETRTYSGAWTLAKQVDITNEKCTSPVQLAYRIPLPLGGEPWDVRVRRITDDSTDDKDQSGIVFESYTVLVEGKFTYPHTACVAIEVDAEDLGSSLPSRAYHVKGRIISVPTNYDPVARTYSGLWNGTFKQAYTNNAAWVFYDLVTNDRFGLGEFITPGMVDKWSLYAIAQYSDAMVPSGFKDAQGNVIYEPRYTYNGVISNRQEAFYALQKITTAWRGMAYWAVGQVFPTIDMPSDPVKLITPANVIGGEFTYSSTATKARNSVAIVKWNDPQQFYQPASELVIDDQALQRFGWREKRIDLEGCTSRGLARRYGKWALDVEQNETETVEYSAGLDHIDLRPGNIIAIADPRKAQVRTGGRIVSHVGNVVTIDADFVRKVGYTYQMMLTMPDGTVATRDITSQSGRAMTVAAMPATAAPNSVFIITSTEVAPLQYRVLSISETEENVFRVTALQHDPLKYARVEQNINFQQPSYRRTLSAQPPTGLSTVENAYVSAGQTRYAVTFSWSPPAGVAVRSYIVRMDTPSEKGVFITSTTGTSVDIPNLEAGSYIFYVQTVDEKNIASKPASIAYTTQGPNAIAAPTVTAVQLADNPGATQFTGRDVRIRWTNQFPSGSLAGAPTDSTSPLYKLNTVRVYDDATGKLLRQFDTTRQDFTYDFVTNRKDNVAAGNTGASRALKFSVTVTDINDRVSAMQHLIVTNPVPALAAAPAVTLDMNNLIFKWDTPSDDDFVGMMIWVSPTSGFSTGTVTPFYDGNGNQAIFKGNPNTDYYYRWAAYDSFGKSGLNISAQQTVKSQSVENVIRAAGLETPVLVSALPADNTRGNLVLLTTDNKLYRWDGAGWTAAVETTDLIGQIGAGLLADGAVGASAMAIGDFSNLCENPSFEADLTGWGKFGGVGAFVAIASDAKTGAKCARRTFTGVTQDAALRNNLIFNAAEGDAFYVSGSVKRDATGVCTSAGVRISWLNSNKVEFSTTSASIAQASLTETYQSVGKMLTAPAGTVFARVELVVMGHSAGNIYWDDVYCNRANGGKLIVDGDIKAYHIATEEIDASHIRANSLTAGLFTAGAIKASDVDIDQSMTISALDAGFIMGKTGPTDFDSDGLYMGRTMKANGQVGFGYLLGRTSALGLNQYIQHTSDTGLKIVNAEFGILTTVSSIPEATLTTAQTYTLDPAISTLSMTILGGGGGGGVRSNTGYTSATAGGSTIVKLYDGTTFTGVQWTASGGAAGASSMSGPATAGESSLLGAGGAAGNRTYNTGRDGDTVHPAMDGGNATGYGAGGGGGSTSGKGGLKSNAVVVSNYDIGALGLVAPKLQITVGAAGSGGIEPTTYDTNGGKGSPGVVKVKQALSKTVPAGVVPYAPTASGFFDKPANATGTSLFPNLKPGFWILYEDTGASLALNELRIGLGGASVKAANASVIAFFADRQPSIVVGNAAVRKINWHFYAMKA